MNRKRSMDVTRTLAHIVCALLTFVAGVIGILLLLFFRAEKNIIACVIVGLQAILGLCFSYLNVYLWAMALKKEPRKIALVANGIMMAFILTVIIYLIIRHGGTGMIIRYGVIITFPAALLIAANFVAIYLRR